VQVFKAHRNCFFEPDDPEAASSIVITAAAAATVFADLRVVAGVLALTAAVLGAAHLPEA
jgi:hypothetical protein